MAKPKVQSPKPATRGPQGLVVIVLLLLAAGGCRAPAKPEPSRDVMWRSLGSWSGRGRIQTESFTSDTGVMRVEWKAANDMSPGAGTFQLTINSAISGRPLQVAVDRRGGGHDVAYVQEDPRVFFAVVDSTDLDWSFTIEEAVTR